MAKIDSSTFQYHRRKLRLEGFTHNLALLSEECDRLPPDHPDRSRLIREMERLSIDSQAED